MKVSFNENGKQYTRDANIHTHPGTDKQSGLQKSPLEDSLFQQDHGEQPMIIVGNEKRVTVAMGMGRNDVHLISNDGGKTYVLEKSE